MIPEETAIERVCIAQGVTDLGKSIDGLGAIVANKK